MKKLILLLALATIAAPAVLGTNALKLDALDATDTTPDFSDDFESYAIDSDDSDIGANWTNGWYEKSGDNNETAGNGEKFKIAADPTDATNKTLYVDTETPNESFFYLTIKDLTVKNFTLEYDYYQDALATKTPWCGITCRKPIDGRYNGVTNVMLTTRLWDTDSMGVQAYRSVDDSFQDLQSSFFGPDGVSATPSYNKANFNDCEGVYHHWIKVKYEVQDTSFKVSINGHLLGQIEITKKTALNYGYVSLVSCVNKGYFDNIKLTNNDTEPYVPDSSSSATTIPAPTMTTTAYKSDAKEDLVIEANLGGEAITSISVGKNEVLTKYYSLDGNKITISKDYLATLNVGKTNFILSTAGGSVSFSITITSAGTSSSESTTTSSQTSTTSQGGTSNSGTSGGSGSSGGCGGAIAGTAAVSALALVGVVVLYKKRKHTK